MIDGNTYNYGYIGSRATGSEAGDYMVVGPDWKGETPAGIKKVFHLDARSSRWRSIRTQLFNPDDMPNVEKVQAGYKVQPLSAFLKQPAPPAAPTIDFPKVNKELVKTNFFEYLDFALQFAPASAGGQGDPRQARQHRHRAGQDVRVQGSLAGAQGRGRRGHEGGRAKDRQVPSPAGQEHQRLERRLVLRRPRLLQGHWLKRAAAAKGGIYGNDAVEAMYPLTTR